MPAIIGKTLPQTSVAIAFGARTYMGCGNSVCHRFKQFYFDKTQEIHLTTKELASAFGISTSTAASKAAELKKMFKIDYFNSEWMLPELIEASPMIWMVQVNGFIVDIRDMPLEVQQQAFEMGIIPYVPGEKEAQGE
jgi:hypothetical protein